MQILIINLETNLYIGGYLNLKTMLNSPICAMLGTPEMLIIILAVTLICGVAYFGKGTSIGILGALALALLTTPIVAFFIILFFFKKEKSY